MAVQRSAAGWALSMFIGSLLGGMLSMIAIRIFAPTLLYVDSEACTSATGSVDVVEAPGELYTAELLAEVANGTAPGGADAAQSFVPGQKAEWADVEKLLKRNEELRDQLAVSRRLFLWTAKLKMSQLKGKLKAVKAAQDRKALSFLLDDRTSKDMPVELQEIMRLEFEAMVGKWQEVDQPTLSEPMPVSVDSLGATVDRLQKAKSWGAVEQCVGSLRRIEDLTDQVRRMLQASLDAESEGALAGAAKERVKELWHGAAEWADSWRQNWDQLAKYTGDGEQRKKRSELAFWVLKFNLLWPVEGPAWYPLAGRNEQQLGEATVARDQVVEKLANLEGEYKARAEKLGKNKEQLEIFLGEALTVAKSSCGGTDQQLEALLLNSATGTKGFCSSKEMDQTAPPAPLAPAYVWKRDWAPDREAELSDLETGKVASTADLRAPVTLSLLMVIQWNQNFVEVFDRLWSCTGGLRGENELGNGQQITMEVIVAVDSNMAAPYRDAILQVLNEKYRPHFVRQVVYVTHGGTGANLARTLNMLAELASAEILVVYEPYSEWPYTNNCHWVQRLVLPFRAWPRMAACGGRLGQMSLYNTPGADYLNAQRNAYESTHNRLKDPVLKQQRVQFVLGTLSAPLALRKSVFLAVGGFNEDAGGTSNSLSEFELCRRMWLAGFQVNMAYIGHPDKVGRSPRMQQEEEVVKELPMGNKEHAIFSDELEGRIVAEVKRENRYLKPTPIWE